MNQLVAIAFVFLICVFPAFAQKERQRKNQTLAEISFKDDSKHHRYILKSDGKEPTFRILFQENQKQPQSKIIPQGTAELIQNEATHIIWNSEYRKPTHVQNCTAHVFISSGDKKTKVCVENVKASAQSYSLLNSMRQLFN